MKFLVDAQLPTSLRSVLQSKGHDVIHTDDLPNKEFTTDLEVRTIADADQRIVITFIPSYLLTFKPSRSVSFFRNQKIDQVHPLDPISILIPEFIEGQDPFGIVVLNLLQGAKLAFNCC